MKWILATVMLGLASGGEASAAASALSLGDMIAARQDVYDLGHMELESIPANVYAMTAIRNNKAWGPATRPAMVLLYVPGRPAAEKIVEVGQADCVHKQFIVQLRLFYKKDGDLTDVPSPVPADGMSTWLTPDAAAAAVKVFCPGPSPYPVVRNTTLAEIRLPN